MSLVLERKIQADETLVYRPDPAHPANKPQRNEKPRRGRRPVVLVTPPIDEAYWQYRVKLSDKQAIIGFPKFMQIGIGFAVEGDDWNTNLPSRCDAKRIFDHIKCNKGDDAISDEDCLTAIKLIQQAVEEDEAAA